MNLQTTATELLTSLIGFFTDYAIPLSGAAAFLTMVAVAWKVAGFPLTLLGKRTDAQTAQPSPATIEIINHGLTGTDTLIETARKQGVAETLITEHLRRFGESNVPRSEWSEHLQKVAEDYKEAKAAVALLQPDEVIVSELLEKTKNAIAEDDIDNTLNYLSELERAERKAITELNASATNRRKNLGNALSARGKLLNAKGQYEDAAHVFEEAAKECEPFDEDMHIEFLHYAATAYMQFGEQSPDISYLQKSRSIYERLLKQESIQTNEEVWSGTQNNLGNVLTTMGEREEGTENLESAVAAYTRALEVNTKDSQPLQWAMVLNNIGNALLRVGERENGSENLKKAADAYTLALEVYTKDTQPLQWAMTQSNLGSALSIIGEREEGTENLKRAVEAYACALEIRTKDTMPEEWATTQNNLGHVFLSMEEREEGPENLKRALEAVKGALKVRTKDSQPLHWAMTQNNLGSVLLRMGKREAGIENLGRAVEAYTSALEIFEKERTPYYWEGASRNLEETQRLIAARSSDSGD